MSKKQDNPLTKDQLDLAKKIQSSLKLDKETGTIGVKENCNPFADTLPENLTIETVGEVGEAYTNFTVAATNAFGKMALKALKDNTDLNKVVGTIALNGNDKLNFSMDREKSGKKPGTDETWTKYGDIRVNAEIFGTNSSKGMMKKLCSYFSEEAKSALSGE